MENQSTQTSAPQAPVPPQAPLAPRPSKKGLWIGLAGIAVILIGVAVVVLVVVFAGPSKADYKKAQEKAQAAADSYNDFRSDFRGVSSRLSSTVDKSDIKKAQEALADYEAKVAELDGQRAFKDDEAKKLYDDFVEKNKEFVSFMGSLLASGDTIADVTTDCSAQKASGLSSGDTATIGDRYNDALTPCLESIEKLSKSDNKPLADYAKELHGLYKDQQALFAKLQSAYQSGNMTAARSVTYEIQSQARKFSSISASEVNDAIKETAVQDQLNALGEYLTDKSNGDK